MVFSSIEFLFYFLPITLLIYFISPRGLRNAVLLLASLVFYTWGGGIFVVILLLSIVVDYLVGFLVAWARVEAFIDAARPEFILFQCGADSIAGDPITHLAYSKATHSYAVTRLCHVANEFCAGRVLAMGGGGYNLDNIAKTWTAVVSAMISVD